MRKGKFLLVLGPSGVGKSTVIRRLITMDPRFVYVSPYTTRPLREGETDKVFLSADDMDRRAAEFLYVNEIGGTRYATPRDTIDRSFEGGKFPVLDWPLDRLGIVQAAYPGRVFSVYLMPPSLDHLQARLSKDGRDPEGLRFARAQAELRRIEDSSLYLLGVDDAILAEDSAESEIALTLHSLYCS